VWGGGGGGCWGGAAWGSGGAGGGAPPPPPSPSPPSPPFPPPPPKPPPSPPPSPPPPFQPQSPTPPPPFYPGRAPDSLGGYRVFQLPGAKLPQSDPINSPLQRFPYVACLAENTDSHAYCQEKGFDICRCGTAPPSHNSDDTVRRNRKLLFGGLSYLRSGGVATCMCSGPK